MFKILIWHSIFILHKPPGNFARTESCPGISCSSSVLNVSVRFIQLFSCPLKTFQQGDELERTCLDSVWMISTTKFKTTTKANRRTDFLVIEFDFSNHVMSTYRHLFSTSLVNSVRFVYCLIADCPGPHGTD